MMRQMDRMSTERSARSLRTRSSADRSRGLTRSLSLSNDEEEEAEQVFEGRGPRLKNFKMPSWAASRGLSPPSLSAPSAPSAYAPNLGLFSSSRKSVSFVRQSSPASGSGYLPIQFDSVQLSGVTRAKGDGRGTAFKVEPVRFCCLASGMCACHLRHVLCNMSVIIFTCDFRTCWAAHFCPGRRGPPLASPLSGGSPRSLCQLWACRCPTTPAGHPCSACRVCGEE